MLAIFEKLITIGARALVKAIVGEVRGEDDAPKAEPEHPRFTDVERMRAQERSSIAASKAAAELAERRRAVTTRPPARQQSDTLPSREDATHGSSDEGSDGHGIADGDGGDDEG
jgi:hypothetical protein